MTQVVAMHEIVRASEPGVKATKDTPGTPPKQEVIRAGTLFEVSGQELDELRANGSVVDPKDKQAARFGYGTQAAQQFAPFVAEEGETVESAAQRQTLRSQTDRTARRSAERGGEPNSATSDKANRNVPRKGREDLVG